MKYDAGGLKGLKAMVTDDVIADLVIGAYHAGPIRKLLQFVNLCSISTMTNSGDILRIHHDEYRKRKFIIEGNTTHMELLYNAFRGHTHAA